MDLQFFGANCIALTVLGSRIVIDDNLASLGSKAVTKQGDIVLFTGEHDKPTTDVKLMIDSPGEFEVGSVSIYGIPVRTHMDESGKKSGTMYKLVWGDISVLVTGHIFPDLTDKQLEAIGMVSVLVIPVGGNGFTLDPIGALSVVKKIEPKIIIPTHYDDQDLNFPVVQQTLEHALVGLAMEPSERTSKLKMKSMDLSEGTRLVVLERA